MKAFKYLVAILLFNTVLATEIKINVDDKCQVTIVSTETTPDPGPVPAPDPDPVPIPAPAPNPTGTIYYVSNNLLGNDSNSGLSVDKPWKNYEHARIKFKSFNKGDSLLFERGGLFKAIGGRWTNHNSTAAEPVTVGAYGVGDRPKLLGTNRTNGFELNPGHNGAPQQGFIIRDLDISCDADSKSRRAIFLYNESNHVTIDNVKTHGCDIGVYAAYNGAGNQDSLSIINSQILNNIHQGFLGSGDNLLIENTVFDNNGSNTNRDHNLYINGQSKGTTIRGNTLTNSAQDNNGLCVGNPIVAHGVHENLLIEGNKITEDKAGQGCWGIDVSSGYSKVDNESFRNVIIKNNEITSVGNVSIHVTSCANCEIVGNIIDNDQTYYTRGILTEYPKSSNDASSSNITLKDNIIKASICVDNKLNSSAYKDISNNTCVLI
jgi:hypothetical protein